MKRIILHLSMGLLSALFITATYAPTSHALTGFSPGHIIDDSVFTDTTTMSADSIQNFLNSKVPICDTLGTQPSEFGGGTRAQWGAARGYSTPFTCLKDYSENGRTAAQIISDTARSYQINPQVLLVLLQKEQGLITDTWPVAPQYKTATGYGCPDTAACDSQYYGFTNQIIWSGKMFRAILNNSPTWYTPYILGNNFIQYSPNSSCGGSTVNIDNRATQALYNYTPYQPNQASLDAGYGSGNSCSSHGNRNFFLYFRDWFGMTTGPAYSWTLNSYSVYADAGMTQKINDENVVNLTVGQSAYVSISARNTGRLTWQQQDLLMGTPNIHTVIRDPTWISRDRTSRMVEQSVPYDSTGTFNFKITAPLQPNTYYQGFNIVIDGLTWFNPVGPSIQFNVSQPVATPPITSANILQSGSTMKQGDVLFSPDHNSVLRFERGQLSLYVNFKYVWGTSIANSLANRFSNLPDGNLVLYNADNSIAWQSNTAGNGISDLVLQNDGNLVNYSSGSATWSSGYVAANQTSRINNILFVNQSLFTKQKLYTPDRTRLMVLQSDGNLVIYTPHRVAWSSRTVGSGAVRLTMQNDGNLVLYRADGVPVWASNTANQGSGDALLQMDSNFVIYGNRQPWSTNSAGL